MRQQDRPRQGRKVADRPYVRVTSRGCWEWERTRNNKGYGRFQVMGEVMAHRVAYRLLKADIPPGYHIDHLCRNPACVNPEHLEAVPRLENLARGIGKGAHALRYNECWRGHPFTEDNTRQVGGTRVCRTCRREQKRLERTGTRAPNLRCPLTKAA